MRVSILCGGSRVFGLEIMALTVAHGLRERGHEVQVLASGWSDGEFKRRLTQLGIPHRTIFLGKLYKPRSYKAIVYTLDALAHLPGARRRVRAHFRQFQPDVVLIYQRDWALLVADIFRQERAIFHVHELGAPTRWTKRAQHRLNRFVRAYAVASQHLAGRLIEIGVQPQKIHVVYNGIDADYLPKPPEPSRVPTIGIVGQVGAWKGHDDLVEALGILERRGIPFRCLVIGSGDEDYVSSLRNRAAALGVEARISWLGYVNDPRAVYRELDICVVPSRFDEPFGLVAAEAGLCGLPVIATNRGGLPEIVVHEQTGFLIEPRRPDVLADRLHALLRDPELRVRLGSAARERSLAMFSASQMVETLEALCLGIAGQTR